MRIPSQLTEYLGNLFGSKNAKQANRSSAKVEDALSARLSPANVVTSEKTADRITLSKNAVATAATLASPTSLRRDIPPAFPATTPPPADPEPTAVLNDGLAPVRALVPVSDDAQTPRQQEAVSDAQERETPETRRLVCRVYGSSQASGQDLQSNSRIRIRA